jgi:hypothetical protein
MRAFIPADTELGQTATAHSQNDNFNLFINTTPLNYGRRKI